MDVKTKTIKKHERKHGQNAPLTLILLILARKIKNTNNWD